VSEANEGGSANRAEARAVSPAGARRNTFRNTGKACGQAPGSDYAPARPGRRGDPKT